MMDFQKGDRVERTTVQNGPDVPVGSKGTVIGKQYGLTVVAWDGGPRHNRNMPRHLKKIADAPRIKVGDRVVFRNYKFGRDCCGTVSRINGQCVWAENWSVGSRKGFLMMEDLEVIEEPKPFAKPQVAPKPNNSGSYIVALEDEDGLHPNKNPKVHHDSGVALLEAERLAKKHGGKFVVLKRMAHAERPPVIIPETTLVVY